MNANQLRTAMKNGQRVYGTLILSPSPKWPELIKKLGLDFVFIDTEHESIDRYQLAWMCQTFKALDIAPIVRITYPDPHQAAMVIDGGAAGVIAPYVETVEQVKALRGAVKFRPLKGQKLQQVLDGNPCDGDTGPYLEQRNENNLLILNIESTPALERLDEIMEVPDIDCLLIGPHDLSCNLGIPEQYSHPKFDETVRQFFRKARSRQISAGIISGITLWPGLDAQIRWMKEDGLNFVLHSSDITSLVQHLNSEFTTLKKALGDPVNSELLMRY